MTRYGDWPCHPLGPSRDAGMHSWCALQCTKCSNYAHAGSSVVNPDHEAYPAYPMTYRLGLQSTTQTIESFYGAFTIFDPPYTPGYPMHHYINNDIPMGNPVPQNLPWLGMAGKPPMCGCFGDGYWVYHIIQYICMLLDDNGWYGWYSKTIWQYIPC